MELAESVNVILRKGKEIYFAEFDNSKSENRKINVATLPDEDIKAFYDLYNDWFKWSAGLFVPQGSILCFVMIIESLFNDKYKIEYEWIGGADPYAAWKEEQENAPKDVVY